MVGDRASNMGIAIVDVHSNRDRRPRSLTVVPTLIDGERLYTDEELFDLVTRMIAGPREVGGDEFGTSYSCVDGTALGDSSTIWRLDAHHPAIPTPDCEPMPKE